MLRSDIKVTWDELELSWWPQSAFSIIRIKNNPKFEKFFLWNTIFTLEGFNKNEQIIVNQIHLCQPKIIHIFDRLHFVCVSPRCWCREKFHVQIWRIEDSFIVLVEWLVWRYIGKRNDKTRKNVQERNALDYKRYRIYVMKHDKVNVLWIVSISQHCLMPLTATTTWSRAARATTASTTWATAARTFNR